VLKVINNNTPAIAKCGASEMGSWKTFTAFKTWAESTNYIGVVVPGTSQLLPLGRCMEALNKPDGILFSDAFRCGNDTLRPPSTPVEEITIGAFSSRQR
jgi:hypothetical protein